MANNTYGTVKQALFDPSKDADIYYYYRPTRSSVDSKYTGFKKLDDASTILSNSQTETSIVGVDKILPGMYTLKLPVSIFGNKGFYTIYITPKEFECKITDVGALVAYPDIKGIVIDRTTLPSELQYLLRDDNLTGYRVEYFDYDAKQGGLKRQEYYRLITSNGLCEASSQNITSSNTNSTGYQYNASGSLCFLTVTPSISPSFKSNSQPYIGVAGQTITIRNTKFDPVCIEVEITEHDIETISYMLEGEQIRNYENGRVSTYNFNGEIYKQFEYSTVKDNYNQRSIAEAKLDKTSSPDRSLDIENIRKA